MGPSNVMHADFPSNAVPLQACVHQLDGHTTGHADSGSMIRACDPKVGSPSSTGPSRYRTRTVPLDKRVHRGPMAIRIVIRAGCETAGLPDVCKCKLAGDPGMPVTPNGRGRLTAGLVVGNADVSARQRVAAHRVADEHAHAEQHRV